MSRFLGIDLGTQSLKAIVHDSENREIAAAKGEPPSISGRQEWLENLINQYI